MKTKNVVRVTLGEVRAAIRGVLNEINIGKLADLKSAHGSTHQMNVAKIVGDERKFFVKFSDIDPDLWSSDDPDPSMQCMSEYLAYRVYALYPNVKIPPRVELVYDPENERVGIATAAVSGKAALPSMNPKTLAKKLQAGVYVDIFLANHDVVGTGSGNVIATSDDDEAIRIDPGSSFKYRAQGGRKGSRWNEKASELSSMIDPRYSAGEIYQYADLAVAAKEFLSVSWDKVSSAIDATQKEVNDELHENGLDDLADQWNDEVNDIKRTLEKRYAVVVKHARSVASGAK